VFILGITSTDTLWKIISFLVLGVTLIIVSLIYTRKKGREKAETRSTKNLEE